MISNIKNKCILCDKKITGRGKTKMCNDCFKIHSRKTIRPSYEELKIKINEFGYNETGRKYNVSDNTIRKWLKNYEKIIKNFYMKTI